MEVTYQGRTFCSDFFRVWVYGKNDTKKLVNSWDEYQDHIGSGEWYSNQSEAQEEETTPEPEVVVIKPKGPKKGGR